MFHPSTFELVAYAYALFTRDILAHNIAIKNKKDIAIKRYFWAMDFKDLSR